MQYLMIFHLNLCGKLLPILSLGPLHFEQPYFLAVPGFSGIIYFGREF